jgi:hypothetical protein
VKSYRTIHQTTQGPVVNESAVADVGHHEASNRTRSPPARSDSASESESPNYKPNSNRRQSLDLTEDRHLTSSRSERHTPHNDMEENKNPGSLIVNSVQPTMMIGDHDESSSSAHPSACVNINNTNQMNPLHTTLRSQSSCNFPSATRTDAKGKVLLSCSSSHATSRISPQQPLPDRQQLYAALLAATDLATDLISIIIDYTRVYIASEVLLEVKKK